jgi:regulator of sirC expression with transglutaminase-like and TPR domain
VSGATIMNGQDEERKLGALLKLLDDPEPLVQQQVRMQLRDLGSTAVVALRTLIDRGGEETVRTAARNLVREIGVDRFRVALAEELRDAGAGGDVDLERSIFAVAYLGYPEIDVAHYQSQIDALAGEVGSRMRPEAGAIENVRAMSTFLVDELGFHGCRQDNFYDPDNSYINRVLERRIGIPISLSVVYLLIARRISLPLHGVSFPAHFLVKYQQEGTEFFIDPFGGGQILDVTECRRMLVALGIEERPEYFDPAPARVIIARLIRNLSEIYRKVDPTVSSELDTAFGALAS